MGEQVREFMSRENLTPTDMAQRVGTSRQNIENLLAGKVRVVKYLGALAQAMGTTADTLLAGDYTHGQRPSEAPRPLDGGWPFQLFSRTVWEALTERQRGAVESAALQMIRQFWSAPPSPPPGTDAGRPSRVRDAPPSELSDSTPAGATDLPAPRKMLQNNPGQWEKAKAHWIEQHAQWDQWADEHRAATKARQAPPRRPRKSGDH